MDIKKILNRVTFLLLLVSIQSNINAQTQLKTDESIKEGKLQNGFRYYIKNHSGEKNKTSIWLVVKTGSLHESAHQRGYANFIRIMNFAGTKNFKEDDINTFLLKSNLTLNPDLNSATSFNHTAYKFLVPTNSSSLIQNALSLLADFSAGPDLSEANMTDGKNKIAQKWNSIDSTLKENIEHKLFPVRTGYSSYSARHPLGSNEIIQKADISAIENFKKSGYQPSQQALIIVGDVNIIEIEKEVIAKFSKLVNTIKGNKPQMPEISSIPKEKLLVITDPKLPQSNINFLVKIPSLQQNSTIDLRNQILRSLFNDLISKRIADTLKSNPKAFAKGAISIYKSDYGFDVAGFSLLADSNRFEENFKALYSILKQVEKKGFSSKEIQEAKSRLLANDKQAYLARDRYYTKYFADQLLNRFIQGSPSLTIDLVYKENIELIKDITTEEVRLMAIPFLKNEKLFYIIAPQKYQTQLPNSQKLENWTK